MRHSSSSDCAASAIRVIPLFAICSYIDRARSECCKSSRIRWAVSSRNCAFATGFVERAAANGVDIVRRSEETL